VSLKSFFKANYIVKNLSKNVGFKAMIVGLLSHPHALSAL